MAVPTSPIYLSLLIALLSVTVPCCGSDEQPTEIVARALACFNHQSVYRRCQESYQLNAQGTLSVPHEATDDYCNGPCLGETKLVLNCIDNILYNFHFYNGASTRDVRYTLRTGCGHSSNRGDFNILDRLNSKFGGDYDGDYDYYYDHGFRLPVPLASTMVLLSCILLFWAA